MPLKIIISVCLVFNFLSLFGQGECTKISTTFYGKDNINEFGYSLVIDTIAKCYYLGGNTDNESLLIKLDLSGKIIWSLVLNLVPNEKENLVHIFQDSEGYLLLGGHAGNYLDGGRIFIAKFDLLSKSLLWSHIINAPWTRNYFNGLIELEDKRILLSTNPHDLLNRDNNAELIFIDPETGLTLSDQSVQYTLQSSESITDFLYHEGNLYGCGRYTIGISPEFMRNIVTKIRLSDLEEEWLFIGLETAGAIARLYGQDLVLKDSSIYSTIFGSRTSSSLTNAKFFIQKTHISDGQPIWVKEYDIPVDQEYPSEMLLFKDRIFVLANKRFGAGEVFLFEINDSGDVVWAKQYTFPSYLELETNSFGQGSICISNEGIGAIITGKKADGDKDIIFFRTDLEGNPLSECTSVVDVEITNTLQQCDIFPISTTKRYQDVEAIPSLLATTDYVLNKDNTCSPISYHYINIDTLICVGSNVFGYTEPGLYIDTLAGTSIYCDTIRTIYLESLNQSFADKFISICHGMSYSGLTQDTIFTDTIVNINGCDSIVTTHLLFYDVITETNMTICSGDNYNGHSSPGIYRDTVHSSGNFCDSIFELHLSVIDPVVGYIDTTICQGQYLHDHTNSGLYADTLTSLVTGCDSILFTNLTVIGSTNTIVKLDLCQQNSAEQLPAGTHIDTLTSIWGCDSIVTTQITDFSNISIPNVFTPNQDGINDQFVIDISPNFDIDILVFSIYDRWGNELFKTTKEPILWDGKDKNGVALQPGVFTYKLHYNCKGLSSYLYGDITIVY